MPSYDFICEYCNYKTTLFVPMKYPKCSKCPKCECNKFIRLIGKGSGIIFKGDGFYETTYKKNQDKSKS